VTGVSTEADDARIVLSIRRDCTIVMRTRVGVVRFLEVRVVGDVPEPLSLIA